MTVRGAGPCGDVAGTLDGDPGIRPPRHPVVGSEASWDEITDDPLRHEAARPAR